MAPDIIIIRGAPGSGKSQTAKALASYYPKGVRLEVDTLRNMVISVDWTNQKEHVHLLEVAAELTKRFLKEKFKPVIIIDTFSGKKLEKFLKDLKDQRKKAFSIKIAGLYCSDEELKRRLELRDKNEFKDFEISKEINGLTKKVKYKNEAKIDTTELLLEQTAEVIYKELSSLR